MSQSFPDHALRWQALFRPCQSHWSLVTTDTWLSPRRSLTKRLASSLFCSILSIRFLCFPHSFSRATFLFSFKASAILCFLSFSLVWFFNFIPGDPFSRSLDSSRSKFLLSHARLLSNARKLPFGRNQVACSHDVAAFSSTFRPSADGLADTSAFSSATLRAVRDTRFARLGCTAGSHLKHGRNSRFCSLVMGGQGRLPAVLGMDP
jgi:hypothetical protein